MNDKSGKVLEIVDSEGLKDKNGSAISVTSGHKLIKLRVELTNDTSEKFEIDLDSAELATDIFNSYKAVYSEIEPTDSSFNFKNIILPYSKVIWAITFQILEIENPDELFYSDIQEFYEMRSEYIIKI